MTAALEHRSLREPTGTPDLVIDVVDSHSSGVARPSLPWDLDRIGPRGEVLDFDGPRHATVCEPGVDLLQTWDRQDRHAVVWAASPDTVPWWEPSFPFRQVLQWWSEDLPLQPVHAGAVAFGGRGALLVGPSGSGKSTTALTALAEGLDYLGDDYVLLDEERQRIHALYATAKLLPETLDRLPWFREHVGNQEVMHETKAVALLPGRTMRSEADLTVIVVPRVAATTGTRVVPLSPAETLRALAPSTMFQLAADRRLVLSKLNRLARAVPGYRIEVGQSVTAVGEALREVLA